MSFQLPCVIVRMYVVVRVRRRLFNTRLQWVVKTLMFVSKSSENRFSVENCPSMNDLDHGAPFPKQALEARLRPGWIVLTWTSMNIEGYRESVHEGLRRLEELIAKANDIVDNRHDIRGRV